MTGVCPELDAMLSVGAGHCLDKALQRQQCEVRELPFEPSGLGWW